MFLPALRTPWAHLLRGKGVLSEGPASHLCLKTLSGFGTHGEFMARAHLFQSEGKIPCHVRETLTVSPVRTPGIPLARAPTLALEESVLLRNTCDWKHFCHFTCSSE